MVHGVDGGTGGVEEGTDSRGADGNTINLLEAVAFPTLPASRLLQVWTMDCRSEKWATLTILGRAVWPFLILTNLRKMQIAVDDVSTARPTILLFQNLTDFLRLLFD